MAEQKENPNNTNAREKARKIYRNFLFCYVGTLILILAVVISYFIAPEKKQPIWFYFGFLIGALYVLIAFLYFREHYLIPYLKDLEKPVLLHPRSVAAWISEWVVPALCIQLLVVVFFWMTTSSVPLQGSLYSEPYFYGMLFKKMDNYQKMDNDLKPGVSAAGAVRKDVAAAGKELDDRIAKKEYVVDKEFGVYLDVKKLRGDETKQAPKTASDKNAAQVATNPEQVPEIIDRPTFAETLKTIYHIPFYIALTFAFLGTLMFTLTDTLKRYYISDLYPKTFMSYTVRFLFAPALCMVIAYFYMNDWPVNNMPILFFLIGFFPDDAMKVVIGRVRDVLGLKKEEKQEVLLDRIQGVTDYNIQRFRELGYETAQHIAYGDLNFLRKNWHNMRQLCDFIAQAILLINIREYFSQLQDAGIRNAISFKHIFKTEETCAQQAKNLNIPVEKLCFVMQEFNRNPLKERIDMLEMIMSEYEKRERSSAASWWGEAARD